MSLLEKIKDDIKQTFKDNQPEKREILRYLVSLLQNEEIRLADKFDDKAALAVLQKEMKRKKESLQMFEKANREDLIAQQKTEIKVLEAYLPKMMSKGELIKLVQKIVDQKKDANFGQVMGKVMAQVKGKADGKLVAQVVAEIVNQK